MFKLGEPLGWHERHRFDHKLLAHFKQKIAAKMPKHREDIFDRWYFEEVLDQLLFYYLIREEVKQEMANVKIKFEQNAIMKRTRLASPRGSELTRLKSFNFRLAEMTPSKEDKEKSPREISKRSRDSLVAE